MNHCIAAGVSTQKLFRALTLDNARALHLDDKIGSVESGKTANLLLLRANPLDSVAAYDALGKRSSCMPPIPRAESSARAASK